MVKVTVATDIADPRWQEALPNIEALCLAVKDAVFAYMEKHEKMPLLSGKKPLIVGVCFSNDAEVQYLNRDFRGMDKPTNVLSFANIDFAQFDAANLPYDEIALGDIIIAYETMEREATAEKITLQAHVGHLLVHGLLHLLGYDHIKDAEAEKMEALEVAILADLGIDNPYKED